MIFITGASGLLGSHVAYALCAKGYAVKALRRSNSDLEGIKEVFSFYDQSHPALFNKIIWVDGNVDDYFSLLEGMGGTDEVYHCAGVIGFSGEDPKLLLKINGEGTANVVNVAMEKGIKKFCHVSSISAIPNHDKKEIIDESIFWKSSPENSAYAISKYAGEQEVWRAIEEGLNAVIVNPSIIIGPGNWGKSTGKIITESHKGIKFYTESTKGYVDVRDVAQCMILLMEKNIFSERFILNSENLSFKDALSFLHIEFGNKVPSIKANKFLLEFARILEKILSVFSNYRPSISKEVVSAALTSENYNNKKIIDAISFNFIKMKDSFSHAANIYSNKIARK